MRRRIGKMRAMMDMAFHSECKTRFHSAYAIIFLMLAIAGIGYHWLPRTVVPLPLVTDCRLDRQICSVALPGNGRLEVGLGPRPISTITPIQVSVSIDGLSVDHVKMDFQGVDMNMGRFQLPLLSDGNGRFRGETTLPVCVTGQMVWQATVLIESGLKNISVPFRFESGT